MIHAGDVLNDRFDVVSSLASPDGQERCVATDRFLNGSKTELLFPAERAGHDDAASLAQGYYRQYAAVVATVGPTPALVTIHGWDKVKQVRRGATGRVDDNHVDRGRPFLICEYLPGKTLDALCREGRLSPSARSRVVAAAFAAFEAAIRARLFPHSLDPADIIVGQDRVALRLFRSGDRIGSGLLQPPERRGWPTKRGYPEAEPVAVFLIAALRYWLYTGEAPYPEATDPTEARRLYALGLPLDSMPVAERQATEHALVYEPSERPSLSACKQEMLAAEEVKPTAPVPPAIEGIGRDLVFGRIEAIDLYKGDLWWREGRLITVDSVGVPRDDGMYPSPLTRHQGAKAPAANGKKTAYLRVDKPSPLDDLLRALRRHPPDPLRLIWPRGPDDRRTLAELSEALRARAPLSSSYVLLGPGGTGGQQLITTLLFPAGQHGGPDVVRVAAVRPSSPGVPQWVVVAAVPYGDVDRAVIVGAWLVRCKSGENELLFGLGGPGVVSLHCDVPFEPLEVDMDHLRGRLARNGAANQPIYLAIVLETTDDGLFTERVGKVGRIVKQLLQQLGGRRELRLAVLPCGDQPHTSVPVRTRFAAPERTPVFYDPDEALQLLAGLTPTLACCAGVCWEERFADLPGLFAAARGPSFMLLAGSRPPHEPRESAAEGLPEGMALARPGFDWWQGEAALRRRGIETVGLFWSLSWNTTRPGNDLPASVLSYNDHFRARVARRSLFLADKSTSADVAAFILASASAAPLPTVKRVDDGKGWPGRMAA